MTGTSLWLAFMPAIAALALVALLVWRIWFSRCENGGGLSIGDLMWALPHVVLLLLVAAFAAGGGLEADVGKLEVGAYSLALLLCGASSSRSPARQCQLGTSVVQAVDCHQIPHRVRDAVSRFHRGRVAGPVPYAAPLPSSPCAPRGSASPSISSSCSRACPSCPWTCFLSRPPAPSLRAMITR